MMAPDRVAYYAWTWPFETKANQTFAGRKVSLSAHSKTILLTNGAFHGKPTP